MKDLNFNEGDISAFGRMLENAFDVKPKKDVGGEEDKKPILSIENNGDKYSVRVNGTFEDIMNMLANLIKGVCASMEDNRMNKMIMCAFMTDTIKKLAKEVMEGDEA